MGDGEKTKPSEEAIKTLLRLYPMLDRLMAETILSFSEEELGKLLETQDSAQEKICCNVINDDSSSS